MRTTNYEISKQLVEAKFKENQVWNQEGQFWGYDLETILEALPKFIKYNNREYCLNFWLNRQIYYEVIGKIIKNDFYIFITEKEENESLADTAAKLWLKLKQEKLV